MLSELASPEEMASFFVNNSTSDFLLIRPRGNPINAEGFQKMMNSGDLQEKAAITKIHRLEFLSNNFVMCIFTLGSKFSYKGIPNDDLPTVTSIFKKWIMFGKFIGCTDQQAILICLYGIRKFNDFKFY